MYVVKFFNGGKPYWLAEWDGDPGRTSKKENAKKFETTDLAKTAMKKQLKIILKDT